MFQSLYILSKLFFEDFTNGLRAKESIQSCQNYTKCIVRYTKGMNARTSGYWLLVLPNAVLEFRYFSVVPIPNTEYRNAFDTSTEISLISCNCKSFATQYSYRNVDFTSPETHEKLERIISYQQTALFLHGAFFLNFSSGFSCYVKQRFL